MHQQSRPFNIESLTVAIDKYNLCSHAVIMLKRNAEPAGRLRASSPRKEVSRARKPDVLAVKQQRAWIEGGFESLFEKQEGLHNAGLARAVSTGQDG